VGSLSRLNDKDHRSSSRIGLSLGQTGWRAALLGFAIFALLWILDTPYREFYVPSSADIPALADGLLLAPGAHWQDWFTRGYSNFWDVYPEWPLGSTGFTRPAFQFVIYLAHFAFGKNWELYRIISCIAAASVGAAAFLIARTALGLRTGLSLLAAALVVLSPPVLQSWLISLANAHEPLTTLLVACAFLAAVARRDFLCLMLLFIALLTKENAVWAPAAAAITIMLRPKAGEPLHRRAIAAAAMFLPIVMWLGLRFAFFDGIGGTYATRYAPLGNFLTLSFKKLKYLDTLFVSQYPPTDFQGLGLESYHHHPADTLLNRAIRIGTRLLIYALVCLWALRVLRDSVNHLPASKEKRWPTADAGYLVAIWAASAIAFHFALPLLAERYATSVVVFTWPAIVAEVERRRNTLLRVGLALCCIVSLIRASYYSIEFLSITESRGNNYRSIEAALRQMPMATRQVYILAAVDDILPFANPEYVRLILGVPAEVVRVIDISWNCGKSNNLVAFNHGIDDGINLVAFNHGIDDGIVKLVATLPACADFVFFTRIDKALENGHLYRNASISYELPEAYTKQKWSFLVGRRITVQVRPSGPARFIIQYGGPNGIAWFDTP
jgi:hypothetical protein